MFAWAFGGSITNPDGSFAGNDANGLAGMDYWTKLKEYMPSGVKLDMGWSRTGYPSRWFCSNNLMG